MDVGTISALEQRDSRMSKYTSALAGAFGLTVEQLLDETNGAETPGSSATQALPVAAIRLEKTTWPFDTPLQQVLALSERDIGRIDGFMQAVVTGAMSTRKSPCAA